VRVLPLLVSIFAVAGLSATGCASISGLAELEVGCDGSSCSSGSSGSSGDGGSTGHDGASADGSNDAIDQDTSLPDGCFLCGGSACCSPQVCDHGTCCNGVGAACSGNGNGGCCSHTSYCPNGGGVCIACKQLNDGCSVPSECCSGTCIASKCGDN